MSDNEFCVLYDFFTQTQKDVSHLLNEHALLFHMFLQLCRCPSPKIFPKLLVHGTFWALKKKNTLMICSEGDCWMFKGTSTAPSYFTGFETPQCSVELLLIIGWDLGLDWKVWWNMILVLEIMPFNVYEYIWHTIYTFRIAILATLAKGTSLKNKSWFSQEFMLLFFESFSVSN